MRSQYGGRRRRLGAAGHSFGGTGETAGLALAGVTGIGVASRLDLGPLELQRDGSRVRFVLWAPEEILLELPPSYEEILRRQLADVLGEPGPLTVEVDLQGLAGITSRQLGALIALQKVLGPRFGRLPLTGVSRSVRHLLELAHMGERFEII